MIAFVQGQVESLEPLRVVINVAGVGYEIHAPLSTTGSIGSLGSTVRLHTHLVVREDSHSLYGFHTLPEKQAFVALTEKVSGVGPKIALNVLSRLSVDSLQRAVSEGNVALLTQCPGIGKKTAERLVLELRDAFAILQPGSPGPVPIGGHAEGSEEKRLESDAVAALVTLGFKQADALKRIQSILKSHSGDTPPTVESLIKSSLSA